MKNNNNTKNKNSNPPKKHVHIYLENLIREKFNVFLEVHHTQFSKTNPGHSVYGKPICARTMVAAYKTKEDVMNAKNWVLPIAISSAECSLKDNFEKRVGLAKALHRLYRVLSVR